MTHNSVSGVGHFIARDDTVAHSEEATDVQMLPRLRHDALVGRDHQHHQIDADCAGDHGANEALVFGGEIKWFGNLVIVSWGL